MNTPVKCQISIQGYLDYRWSKDLGDLTIVNEFNRHCRPTTLLLGRLVDQAALLGVLNRLYGLGLPLLWVQCLASTNKKPD